MTSFRRVFVLLVVAFAADTTPSLVFKSFDDLFASHRIFIHTNTHCVKVKKREKLRFQPGRSTGQKPPVFSQTVGEMKKMIKNLTIVSLILIILVAAIWIYDVVSDRKHEITILKPITLLEKAPHDYPASNRETGKISVGEQVKVLRMGYGKDFRTWKVRGSAGQEGWFIEDNDSFKFKNNGNNINNDSDKR